MEDRIFSANQNYLKNISKTLIDWKNPTSYKAILHDNAMRYYIIK